MDDDYDDGDCWNCGGEGRINLCIDGCCVDQDDIYCPYCSKRCDVCNPKPPITGTAVSNDREVGAGVATFTASQRMEVPHTPSIKTGQREGGQ